MNNFQYVTKKQLSPVKKELIQIINSVQNEVRHEFTFQYIFVGSTEYNMVTYDVGTNVGYDFDVNMQVNTKKCNLSAKEIKTKIRKALDKIAPCFGYDNAEDSTRVITIKFKDRKSSKIVHSCDFAIVNDYTSDKGITRQKYIHFDKRQNSYSWQEQPNEFYLLKEKVEWIKNNGYWNEVKELYIKKKNLNNDYNKHSRSIFAETIYEICQKHGYNNQ